MRDDLSSSELENPSGMHESSSYPPASKDIEIEGVSGMVGLDPEFNYDPTYSMCLGAPGGEAGELYLIGL